MPFNLIAMSAQTESIPPVERTNQRSFASRRLMSLDALRGFDMFWIIGADSLVYALNQMSQTRPAAFLAYGLVERELFLSDAEVLTEAYRRQGEKIAYEESRNQVLGPI